MTTLLRSCLPVLTITILMPTLCRGQTEARPTAPRLLPSKTFAYFRIDDSARFREKLSESSMGRMAADPKVRPLMSQVYAGAEALTASISERLGVTMDELVTMGQGEFCLALVPTDPQPTIQRMAKAQQEESKSQPQKGTEATPAPDDESPDAIRARMQQRRREERLSVRFSFGLVAIIDTKDRTPVVQRLLENIEQQMKQLWGFQRTDRNEFGVDIVSLQRGNRPESMHYLIHDGTLVIGNNRDAVTNILLRWKGSLDDERLSANTNFTTIMSHCIGTEETRPQVTFYIDPFRILDTGTAAGGGAGMFMFVLHNLGVEGIKGVGGSGFVGGERFESIFHLHALLDTRRAGVLSVIRPQEGPVSPPSFVPADAINYMAINWNVEKTVQAARRVYDQVRGEGSFDEDVLQRAGAPMKLDTQVDFLDQMTGRFTLASWLEPTARLGSQVSMQGAQVKDPELMAETIEKGMKNLAGWKAEKFAGVTIFAGPEATVPESMRDYVRQSQPHLAVIGDHLVLCDSRLFVEHLIATQGGIGLGELSTVPEFNLIAGELSGQLDGRPPFMFSFSRPEESFRAVYELVKNPQMRQGLRQLAERNPVAKMFYDALEENELPPLSVFTQYFSPAGSFAYDDTSGLHMASFGLQK
ncbi:MAG: hypothetical protein R3C05_13720 [Pirellulaceae bacterium]